MAAVPGIVCGGQNGGDAVRVRILSTPPTLVRPDMVRAWCRGASEEGCTLFLAPSLNTSCVAADTGWTMRGEIRALTRIYLARAEGLVHERTHVRDVEQSALRYLSALAERRHDTESACLAMARAEEERFGAMFQSFARESQHRRR